MADYQVIIVGAGLAGCTAATVLARQGKSVLLIERGSLAGSKNMTGGRIYSHALKSVFPNFEEEAPIERKIVNEKISFITSTESTTIDFFSLDFKKEDLSSYSVLRAPFDNWLASKAEEAGADCVFGITVEDLVFEDGRVVGIRAGDDEISADITILADGTNSLLAEKAGLTSRPLPHTLAVGVKEIIELPEKTIDDRFLRNTGEGSAWLFAGDATKGHTGGGFLYTNRESISIGLVATLPDLCTSNTPLYQMMEDFKDHPVVAPMIRGGRLVEYSGHLVPEGGYYAIPQLYKDGCLLVGDAAMLCVNLGYQVRGMDYAVASGEIAGQVANDCLEEEDCSASKLADYHVRLEESFVLKDLKAYKNFPKFMAENHRIFNDYPQMIAGAMKDLFRVDGSPVLPLKEKLISNMKKVGLRTLVKDIRKGLKTL